MAGTLDNKKYTFSPKDIIYIIMLVSVLLSNYYIVKASITEANTKTTESILAQDKVNAVTSLEMQTLDVRLTRLEADLREFQKQHLTK